ncbi:hypothetical protein [Salmonella enterica]|uniref:hypothetical protein n=1 Tax=Salmonella enterica TaxID=28901 RepID=UPI00398C4808
MQPNQDGYNLIHTHYFIVGGVRPVSLSVNGVRTEYEVEGDEDVYVSFSIP